jgi:hypothetical protein
MEPSENSELRAATTGQAKSTGYFLELRGWPEFDLIHTAGSNRLIVGSKTVRTIDFQKDGNQIYAATRPTRFSYLASYSEHSPRHCSKYGRLLRPT